MCRKNSINPYTGWTRLIRSHSSARFSIELSGIRINSEFKHEMTRVGSAEKFELSHNFELTVFDLTVSNL